MTLGRGSSEALIRALVFDCSDSYLFVNSSRETIHIFDLKNSHKNPEASPTYFQMVKTGIASGISKIWAGDTKSTFKLDKPKDFEVSIICFEEELLIVTKTGEFFRISELKETLKNMYDDKKDRVKIEFQAYIYESGPEKFLTDDDPV